MGILKQVKKTCVCCGGEYYNLDISPKLYETDNVKKIEMIKNNQASLKDHFFIFWRCFNRTCSHFLNVSDDNEEIEEIVNFIKRASVEEIEKVFKFSLSPVNQDVKEMTIKINGPEYLLKNLSNLFTTMNNVENALGNRDGIIHLDMLYTYHTQKVNFAHIDGVKFSDDCISHGNSTVEDYIVYEGYDINKPIHINVIYKDKVSTYPRFMWMDI